MQNRNTPLPPGPGPVQERPSEGSGSGEVGPSTSENKPLYTPEVNNAVLSHLPSSGQATPNLSIAPVSRPTPSPSGSAGWGNAPLQHHSGQLVTPASSSLLSNLPVQPSTEPTRPPRPPNAWILYRSDCIKEHRAARLPTAAKPTQADLSKLFGEKWRHEPEEVKSVYERLAETAREEHAQKYPDWRFSRKPQKPVASTATSTSSTSPRTKNARLAVTDKSSKRRRTVSRGSSELSSPPFNGLVPDSMRPNSSYSGNTASMRNGQSPSFMHNPLLPREMQEGRDNRMPSVLLHEVPMYAYPPAQEASGDSLIGRNSPGGRTQYSNPSSAGGLDSTLALRNQSAAQFFNLNEQHSPGSSFDPRAMSNGAVTSAGSHNGFASAYDNIDPRLPGPHNNGNAGQFFDDNSLAFDQPLMSLPSLPFGMLPEGSSNNFDDRKQWYPVQAQAPTFGFPDSSVSPTSGYTYTFDYPDWLYGMRHVRVRRDDQQGTPLLDLLNDWRANGVPQHETTIQPSSAGTVYSFP